MTSGLRKHLKQLPYFLLYNYPAKMKTYKKLSDINKSVNNKDEKVKLNAYHSPSPMNELCDYICSWEKKHIVWNNNVKDLVDTRCLIINNNLNLSDKKIKKICRRYVNQYADFIKSHYKDSKFGIQSDPSFNFKIYAECSKNRLIDELQIPEELVANYVISVSYSTFSISKSFAWIAFGDYILKNLGENSSPKRSVSITETPYKTRTSYEYLGKYYEFKEGDIQ